MLSSMIPSANCVAFVQRFESCSLEAYLDPAGIPTIGWGHTAGVKMVVGHTASFNPSIQKMRELIISGEVGKLGMISATAYTDWNYFLV